MCPMQTSRTPTQRTQQHNIHMKRNAQSRAPSHFQSMLILATGLFGDVKRGARPLAIWCPIIACKVQRLSCLHTWTWLGDEGATGHTLFADWILFLCCIRPPFFFIYHLFLISLKNSKMYMKNMKFIYCIYFCCFTLRLYTIFIDYITIFTKGLFVFTQ